MESTLVEMMRSPSQMVVRGAGAESPGGSGPDGADMLGLPTTASTAATASSGGGGGSSDSSRDAGAGRTMGEGGDTSVGSSDSGSSGVPAGSSSPAAAASAASPRFSLARALKGRVPLVPGYLLPRDGGTLVAGQLMTVVKEAFER